MTETEEKSGGSWDKSAIGEIQCLLDLHDKARGRFYERDKSVWRFSLAVWSAMGVAALLAAKGEIALDWVTGILGAAVLVGSCCLHIWIVGRCSKMNQLDQNIASSFLKSATMIAMGMSGKLESDQKKEIESAIGDAEVERKATRGKHPVTWAYWAITILLAGLVAIGGLASNNRRGTGQVLKLDYSTSQPSKTITVNITNQ